ncbi:hypothetical protein EM20IM_00420 [Candidatus Methylacidiphilum infernorum]|uniref:Uncharacterized protein n=2 Tax=Candidatus Methylacidiphilum infernorum TaxID=511746 RepID=A0ABX7PW24_9BACT|nr:hypothetical protein EM20IM_00420 [Candidatus Methylacidiphilum infernorum]
MELGKKSQNLLFAQISSNHFMKRKAELLVLFIFLSFKLSLVLFPSLKAKELPEEVDLNPLLAESGWADRSLKWMIESGESHHFIRPDWIDTEIEEFLKDEQALSLIQNDLLRGDGLLADALTEAFHQLRVGSETAKKEVLEIAHEGKSKLWIPLLSHSQALWPLRNYLLYTPNSYPPVLFALKNWENGSPEALPDLVMETLLKTIDIKPSKSKNLEENWEIARRLARIGNDGRGAYFLASTTVRNEDSFYNAFWDKAEQRVRKDPVLSHEYTYRLERNKKSWNVLSRTLKDALASYEGKDFFIHYLVGRTEIKQQLQGRPLWLWEALMDKKVPFRIDLADEAYKRFLIQLEKDPKLLDFILWHLTRPAEAASEATKEALSQGLSKEEPICKIAMEWIWEAGPKWEGELQASSSWNLSEHTRHLNPATLRKSYQNGQFSRSDLLAIGDVLGSYLIRSDSAWADLVYSKTGRFPVVEKFFPLLVQYSPGCALAWLESLANNDQESFEAFGRWICNQPEHKVSLEQYDSWLNRAGDQLKEAVEKKEPLLGEEAQYFIDSFVKWTMGPGWEYILNRLWFETIIPEMLRKLIKNRWLSDKEQFWKWYRGICALPAAKTAIERVTNILVTGKEMELILQGIASWNYELADVCASNWDTIWEDPQKRTKIVEAILHCDGLSELNNILVFATENTLERPDERKIAQKIAAVYGRSSTEDIQEIIAQDPVVIRSLLPHWLESPQFAEHWKRSVFLTIKYGGQAPIIAQWMLSKKEAIEMWTESLAETMQENPFLLQAIITHIGRSIGGEISWAKEVRRIEERVMDGLLSDRIFWENLIVDKTGGIENETQKILYGLP